MTSQITMSRAQAVAAVEELRRQTDEAGEDFHSFVLTQDRDGVVRCHTVGAGRVRVTPREVER